MARKTTLRVLQVSAVIMLGLGLMSCATSPKSTSYIEEHRASLRAMVSQTLTQLYQKHPDARAVVANSAGYAVFSDFGFKVWTAGGANGKGVAVNNATKEETFMKMLELQPGMGLGVTKFRLVFLFATTEALNKFVTSGWEFGANAMAAAQSKTTGGALAGAVSLSKDVELYQLNESGLIVGVSVTAAKFSQDKQLN